MKHYTHDWNGEFKRSSYSLSTKSLNLCLEIGSFEGLTSNYIVDNILSDSGKLICIDPLTDNYLNDNLTEYDESRNKTNFAYFKDQYSRFTGNVREHLDNGKIELIRDLSVNVFPDLVMRYKDSFDLIYIDGDHRPEGVYIDAVNCFIMCKPGGYIIFDDYGWENTGIGIDKFLQEYAGKYSCVDKGAQVTIRKI